MFRRILQTGERDAICQLEIAAIEARRARDRRFGYNIALGGDISPMHSLEVARRVGETKRLLWLKNPDAMRTAVALLNSPESRAKANAKIRSPKHRAAQSARQKGLKLFSSNAIAAGHTPEIEEKRSKSVRATWSDPVLRAEQSERMKLRPPPSIEQRAQISATLMGHPSSGKGKKRPEIAALISSLRWINNGSERRRVPHNFPLPDGWKYGQGRFTV